MQASRCFCCSSRGRASLRKSRCRDFPPFLLQSPLFPSAFTPQLLLNFPLNCQVLAKMKETVDDDTLSELLKEYQHRLGCNSTAVPAAGGRRMQDASPVAAPATAADDSCTHANDGFCDEPYECAMGTDKTDCALWGFENGNNMFCRYTDDGGCDEVAYCPAGSDTHDCCRGGVPRSADTSGTAIVAADVCCGGDCVRPDPDWCRHANNGECDDPHIMRDFHAQCPPGTDTSDCDLVVPRNWGSGADQCGCFSGTGWSIATGTGCCKPGSNTAASEVAGCRLTRGNTDCTGAQCTDDPDGRLLALGKSCGETLQTVGDTTVLVSCLADIGGTTVSELCPQSCHACNPIAPTTAAGGGGAGGTSKRPNNPLLLLVLPIMFLTVVAVLLDRWRRRREQQRGCAAGCDDQLRGRGPRLA